MDSNQFIKSSRRKAAQIANYIDLEAPAMVAREVLRFVDGNFRAQAYMGYYQGKPWAAIKRKGTILVKTGRLRRGVQYTTNGRGEVRFYNNVPYADVHNRGFNGTVTVKAHTRARYAKGKVFAVNEFTRTGRHRQRTVTTKVGEHAVGSFTRKMKIPQRQFMPTNDHDSPVLTDTIRRELEKEFKRILTI